MVKNVVVIATLALVCLLPAAGVGQTIMPSENLRILADISRFRGADDDHLLITVGYAIPQSSITYKADSAGFSGAADISLYVLRGDSVAWADRWLVPHSMTDTSAVKPGMNLVGQYDFHLGEGDYVFKFLGRDRYDPLRSDSMSFRLPIRKFPTSSMALSDVELASSIRKGVQGSLFYKNTLEVIPNVGGIYHEDAICYFYAEAYNLLATADTGNFYVRTAVFDGVGKEVISRERPRKRSAESTVIVDQLSVKNLRTGTYTLVLSLLDDQKTSLSSSGRKFFVYNPTLGVDTTLAMGAKGLPMPEYMAMDEEELDREFRWSRYASTDDENRQYEQLKGTEAKRTFLSDFWRRRSPGLREEYLSRIAYANANYSVLSREGYRTDRGRVVVMYGHPDDIERHPNETESRPFEIWSYHNIQGGVVFVFVQRNQAGDYELVHSTHRNELHDESWDRVGITR